MCCHWNANSTLAHNKIALLTAYNLTQRSDTICISETYLDSSVDDETIDIPGLLYLELNTQIIRKTRSIFIL